MTNLHSTIKAKDVEAAAFGRRKKHEEVRSLNHQFRVDRSRVYGKVGQMVNDDKENDRPKFKNDCSSTPVDAYTFESVEEASRFWRQFWEGWGTGNEDPGWLEENNLLSIVACHHLKRKAGLLEHRKQLRSCQRRKVGARLGQILRLTNFWWKRVCSLHVNVVTAFRSIAEWKGEYPKWFSEGKKRLIP